jgi:hypothetical protein
MARMTIEDLIRRGVIGRDAFSQLYNKAGVKQWQTAPGGNTESGGPIYEDTPNPDAIKALQGYTFDWNDTGTGNTGTLTAYDPSGNPYGQFQQQDTSTLQSLGEAAALAAAGFGGVGLMGLGPLAGLLGGAGAASSIAAPGAGELAAYGATLTPAEIAATATGLDLGAAGAAGGLGTVAGGSGLSAGIAGGGLTAPTLGATAGVGSGLGMAGAGAGAGTAATGSFWGGLAKAAIPAALSTGAQLIAANKAAGAQQDATRAANDLQRYVYDTTRADNMPALQARNSALQQMQSLLSDPSSLTKQPGYQFGLDQGTRTLNNGAAARGMTYSGAAGKALTRYGQDYAGSKLNESFNRLSALAGAGQPGAGTIAGAGSQYGQTVGNNLTAMGDANAAKYIVGGNAIGNAVNGLTAYGQRQGWWGG